MHRKEQYEIIITSKLEALPVPDMADAIWARIERQLDIDLPEDGGNVPEPPAPGGSGFIVGAGLVAFVGALFSLFYFKQPDRKNNLPLLPQTQKNSTLDTLSPEFIPGKTISTPRSNTPSITNSEQPFSAEIDSANTIVVSDQPLTLSDTTPAAAPQTNIVTTLPPDIKKDSALKKPRGVQGIGNADYRIIPQKDSN